MHACETVLHWERVRGVRMNACKTVVLHHDSVRDKDMSDAAAVSTAAVASIRSSVPLHAKDDKRSRGETGATGEREERKRRGREAVGCGRC